ncbi:Two-component transcriptional response regulator, LuxR family [hydrothermal vent metagenome]|uniref:Two-component transcriptional response regulator, LuxR family n=1 Tax=hydrothermal vent metagenome TaxID=652676 RepID=A0A3B1C4K1_9ZZZZ
MNANKKPLVILMADDDEDDCLLAKKALEKADIGGRLDFVTDGEALLDYLCHRGDYAETAKFPKPDIILLDLNMPKMNGIEALKGIKANPELCHIPTIILTTSRADCDISESYSLGANSFITKPVSFMGLVDMMHNIKTYWFDVVELPNGSVAKNC